MYIKKMASPFALKDVAPSKSFLEQLNASIFGMTRRSTTKYLHLTIISIFSSFPVFYPRMLCIILISIERFF